MNILYLLNSADLAGAETCFLRLITELVKNKKLNIIVINENEGILNDKLRSLGIKVYVYPGIYLKKIYLPKHIRQVFINAFALRKIIKLDKPDLIHAFTLPLARRILFLRLIGINTKVVGTIHDPLDPKSFGKIKVRLFVYIINKYYKYIISVSKSIKKLAIKQGIKKEKIKVIYNGIPIKNLDNIDIEKIKKKDKINNNNNNFIIGCFGRITPKKGQHILLEAVLKLKNKIPELKCLIIGKPSFGIKGSLEYYEYLKNFVSINNLQNIVEFIEWTDNINYYYDKLSIYILPSIYPDPFPTVNLEAMLHKKPVIAVDIGGSKEQVVDGITGFIIEPGNSNTLAEKLFFLYKNPKIAKNFGKSGFERVKVRFNMKVYSENYLSLYKKILKK
ncbi:MAG: glycosyltransferase family 4 protein [Promethearchaeota archaeon]